ncbi:MAG: LysM peptidoglycan-binding domain-containing protein [Gammaproteobacteria bacterium]|nr:LysM peptidoglycan-binding domain-containing protein [Gammaproteobacteria bacterium]
MKIIIRGKVAAPIGGAFLFLLSSCGVIPVPPIESPSEPVDLPQIETGLDVTAESTESSEEVEEIGALPQTPDPESHRPVLSSVREYIQQGILYLQKGDQNGARWAFNGALELSPNNKRASKLLSQLDDDPVEQLGSESFEYRIEYGDSLSKLAKQYLNDPLLFYLLARYNHIEKPSDVKMGQKIRIPGEQSVADSDTRLAAMPNTDLQRANSLYELGKYSDVINELENSLTEKVLSDSEKKALNHLLTNALLKQASHLEKQQKTLAAKDLLHRATALQPGNADIRFQLEALSAKIEVDQYYQQGLRAIENSQNEEAFRAFDKVLELQPDHIQAKAKKEALFLEVADSLYKRALLAQRRQDLEGAILLWDEFLSMMPENENARLYREKAIRMKINLKKFAAQ